MVREGEKEGKLGARGSVLPHSLAGIMQTDIMLVCIMFI